MAEIIKANMPNISTRDQLNLFGRARLRKGGDEVVKPKLSPKSTRSTRIKEVKQWSEKRELWLSI